MKNILSLLVASFSMLTVGAQSVNKAQFNYKNGLEFNFNNGAYSFQIGGFVQPAYRFESYDSVSQVNANTNNPREQFLNAKRTFFQIGGKAQEEKVSFFIQTNFSDKQPLLDAWIAYHPTKSMALTFGQKQTFTNNREMIFREDRLQFTERGMTSNQFSANGREFGLFMEGKFGSSFGIAPQIAVTSGDGRNSFGADSRDNDLGGLKYGARLDVYPLGYFKEGNDLYSADLMHEETLKIVLGGAYSINYGASNSVGEGHGDFLLYDLNGDIQLPNYKQIYVDLLAKYKGFSLLVEFGNGFAGGMNQSYTSLNATGMLIHQQISQYLNLGNVMNGQVGYVTQSGYGFDFRYGQTWAEFEDFNGTQVTNQRALTYGFSKYFEGNNIKLQASYTQLSNVIKGNTGIGELMLQFAF